VALMETDDTITSNAAPEHVSHATQLDEALHWLKSLLAMRKRTRERLAATVPEQYQWMCNIRKTHVASALLKILMDITETADKVLYWPHQCLCDSPCDFCVFGNSASVLALMQDIVATQFELNFVAWWKRYVRIAAPRQHNRQVGATVLTYSCFTILQKPDFFAPGNTAPIQVVDTGGNAANAANADHAINTIATIATVADPIANTDKDNGQDPIVMRDGESVGAKEEATATKVPRIYKCSVCGMPRRGHACRGIAPPPLPAVDRSFEAPKVPPPLTTAQTPCETFASIFVPEETASLSRLERLFGSTRLQTGNRNEAKSMRTDIADIDF
jgi:hypothetical protein